MNIWRTGFSYTKSRYSQQVELGKIIHLETVHLIRLTAHNYHKAISLHKELICFCTYKKKKYHYITTNIKLISKT
jgi:hypothetical protein